MYGEQQARLALCGGGRRKRAEQGLEAGGTVRSTMCWSKCRACWRSVEARPWSERVVVLNEVYENIQHFHEVST